MKHQPRVEDLLELGVLTKPHGIRGALKLHLHNPASSALVKGEHHHVCLIEQDGRRRWVEIEVVGATKEAVLVGLEGVEDRSQAEVLCGCRLLTSRTSLEEGQYYYSDLVGCQVVDETGEEVGEVFHLFEAGASDVLVIRQGGKERYLPFVDQWVVEVDLENRRICVRDLEQWESWAGKDL